MHSLFQSVGVNKTGVDYICADIHGHFSLLEQLLDRLGFDPSSDRLFSLGDLIDRGEESEDVLNWLEKDWFYAIQGNHERMLINAVDQRSSQLFLQWRTWGGEWAEGLTISELEHFSDQLKHLPIALELDLPNNKKVGLVHAELPNVCDWNDIKSVLIHTSIDDVEKIGVISDMLWKSSQPQQSDEGDSLMEPVQNIDHVFHGHSIVDVITTLTNRTFMDLGSYMTGEIGIVKPSSRLSL